MSSLSSRPATHSIDLLLRQAQTAVQQGNKPQARHLLQQAVRQDPQDYRGWLWLATVAQTPQASLEYINRAEMLSPDNPTVRKARLWAEKQLQNASPAPEAASPAAERPSRPALRWLIWALLAVFLGVGGWFAWQSFGPGSAAETAVSNAIVANDPSNSDLPLAATAVHPKPTATQTSQPHVPAKLVASTGSDQPRPTWTVTPTPSPTPTPTPTVVPTFVNANYQDSVRPFGVGANERWVDVNLSTQTLRAYEGDNVVFTTLISSGTWDHPTVTGQFRIWLEFESQTMDGRLLGYDYYLENVPYVMYFYQDYALHGTFWHSNFGTPMSHGCVNMETGDAGWLYNFVTIGTLVNVHY